MDPPFICTGSVPASTAGETWRYTVLDQMVACRAGRVSLTGDGYAMHFVTEAYKHLKVIGAFGAGVKLLPKAGIAEQLAADTAVTVSHGVVTTAAADDLNDEFFDAFAVELARHRAWGRSADAVPA